MDIIWISNVNKMKIHFRDSLCSFFSYLPETIQLHLQSIREEQYYFVSFLAYFLLLSKVHKMGIPWEELDIHFEGKPFFIHHPKIEFNLSHSKNSLIVAIADHPIGIDIELVREIPSFMFSKITSVFEAEAAKDTEDKMTIWTKKESYFKCVGTGLFIGERLKTCLENIPSNFRITKAILQDENNDKYIVSICEKIENME